MAPPIVSPGSQWATGALWRFSKPDLASMGGYASCDVAVRRYYLQDAPPTAFPDPQSPV